MKALDTVQLKEAFKNDVDFLGVFAIDQVPLHTQLPLTRTVKFIANLDPSTLPGTHWVAVKRKDGHGFYFDSFGRVPNNVIQTWLANNCIYWTYNRKTIQSTNDMSICGYLCIMFLKDNK